MGEATNPLAPANEAHEAALNLMRLQARWGEALPHAERALSLAEAAIGADGAELVPFLRTLMMAHLNLGAPAMAEATARRALALCEDAFGPEHPEVMTALENVAAVLQAVGQLQEALPLLQRAARIGQKVLPPGDPRRIGLMVALGSLGAVAQGEGPAMAAMHFTAALMAMPSPTEMNDAVLKLRALNGMAVVMSRIPQMDAARAFYRQAIELSEQTFGPEHPELEAVLGNLASLERACGNVQEAERLEARARRLVRKGFSVIE